MKAIGKEIKHRADYARNLAARKADKGAFFTPEAVADVVLANPPFDPSAPAPDAANQTQD